MGRPYAFRPVEAIQRLPAQHRLLNQGLAQQSGIESVIQATFWPLFVPPSVHCIHYSVKIKEREAN